MPRTLKKDGRITQVLDSDINAIARIYTKAFSSEPFNATIGNNEVAEKLVNLRLFEGIYVENHSKGYVAKVKFFPGCEPKRPDEYISKSIGKEFGLALKD